MKLSDRLVYGLRFREGVVLMFTGKHGCCQQSKLTLLLENLSKQEFHSNASII